MKGKEEEAVVVFERKAGLTAGNTAAAAAAGPTREGGGMRIRKACTVIQLSLVCQSFKSRHYPVRFGKEVHPQSLDALFAVASTTASLAVGPSGDCGLQLSFLFLMSKPLVS